jgi:creatinine amidohydrolase
MDNVIVAPVLPYGQHSTARNMPGTLAISFDAVRMVVREILESLIRHGIRRIVVISGHAGTSHMTAVTEACRAVAEGSDADIMMFSDFHIASGCGLSVSVSGDGHGGLIETSRMLDIRPELVKDGRPSGRYADFGHRVIGNAGLCMPDGIVGDTEGSSAETGKRINDFIIKEILKMLS